VIAVVLTPFLSAGLPIIVTVLIAIWLGWSEVEVQR
jgi:hypothetical protein